MFSSFVIFCLQPSFLMQAFLSAPVVAPHGKHERRVPAGMVVSARSFIAMSHQLVTSTYRREAYILNLGTR
jgi:hypothetical protein